MDKETIDKLEALDFLKADVFKKANEVQLEIPLEVKMLTACQDAIAKDGSKAAENILQVLQILHNLQIRLCLEKKVPSPTKD